MLAAVLDLMVAPGYRRLHFMVEENMNVMGMSDMTRFVRDCIYPLCQHFEVLERVETDARSEFLFTLEFSIPQDEERTPIPWAQLLGGQQPRGVVQAPAYALSPLLLNKWVGD